MVSGLRAFAVSEVFFESVVETFLLVEQTVSLTLLCLYGSKFVLQFGVVFLHGAQFSHRLVIEPFVCLHAYEVVTQQ